LSDHRLFEHDINCQIGGKLERAGRRRLGGAPDRGVNEDENENESKDHQTRYSFHDGRK
jgi:hypothetical protein